MNLPEDVKVYIGIQKDRIGHLTTNHAASSDGVPVLIVDGKAYKPRENPIFHYLKAVDQDHAAHPLLRAWEAHLLRQDQK